MVVRTDAPAPAGTTSHRTSADRTGQAQAAAVWARSLELAPEQEAVRAARDALLQLIDATCPS